MRKVTFKGTPLTLKGSQVKTGEKAPDFKAINQDLSVFDLYEATAGKVAIISSVPSVDTGICQLQTKRFNQEATGLSEDVVIVTVSVDLPFAQGRFCAAEGIDRVKVVSDHKDLDFGTKFGFVIDELRLLARGIVVLDAEGIVRYAEICPEVAEHPDYDAALATVKSLL